MDLKANAEQLIEDVSNSATCEIAYNRVQEVIDGAGLTEQCSKIWDSNAYNALSCVARNTNI